MDQISESTKLSSYTEYQVGGQLYKMLTDHGLWPSEAVKIISSINKDEPLAEVMGDIWDDYPTEFKAVAWMTVRRRAIEWIDANKPMHFARYALAQGEEAAGADKRDGHSRAQDIFNEEVG